MLRSIISFLFAVLAATIAPSFAARADSRAALVIGNSDYLNSARLPNPVKDAAAVADALRRLGFQVTHLDNLTAAGMRKALAAFEDAVNGADWAVVYYAGHGMELDGKNWLIPVDAALAKSTDVADETIPLDRVLERARGAKSLRVVILDACRNNPFVPRMTVSRGFTRSVTRGLAPVEPQQGEVIFYSARDGSTALDGQGSHSPFAQALLSHIETPGLELGNFFREVTSDVLEATAPDKQEPFVYGLLPRQQFYFNASVPVRPEVPAAVPPNAANLQNDNGLTRPVGPVPLPPHKNYTQLVPRVLEAPSFPCDRAGLPIEKLICADADLSEMDSKLGVAYHAATDRTQNREAVKNEQFNWLTYRNSTCRVPSKGDYQAASLIYAKPCLLRLADDRIRILQSH